MFLLNSVHAGEFTFNTPGWQLNQHYPYSILVVDLSFYNYSVTLFHVLYFCICLLGTTINTLYIFYWFISFNIARETKITFTVHFINNDFLVKLFLSKAFISLPNPIVLINFYPSTAPCENSRQHNT